MPFEVKQKKTGGRKKGTPNKRTAIIRTMCDYIVSGGLEKFEEEFNKLKGKSYVDAFIKLSEIATEDAVTSGIANNGLVELFNEKIKNNGTNK